MLIFSLTQASPRSPVAITVMAGVGLVALAPFVAWPGLARRLGRWVLSRRRRPVAPRTVSGVSSREPIPAGVRFAVLHRDGFRCRYCGRGEPDGVKLHLDHLVPVAAGGRNELDNLIVACQDCNLGKSAKDVVGPNHS